jgi:hypothetical protein
MSYRDMFRLVGLTIISIFCLYTPALAAPQILAVLATSSGVPFTCSDGLCRAELSTYCLQRDRPAPGAGTIYHPAATRDFTLSVKTHAGKMRNLPAAEHVAFVEARGFMSISAVIEERQLKRLGSLEATIQIGENASMLPQSVPGDPNPLTAKEIAYTTKSLRQHAKGIVDDQPGAMAARLLTRIMNTMPERGNVSPGDSGRLWQNAIGEEIDTLEGLVPAKKAYGNCFRGSQSRAYGGVRRCLEFRHDEFIRSLNVDYWDSQPGS